MKRIVRDTCVLAALMILCVFTASIIWVGMTDELRLVILLFFLSFIISLANYLIDEYMALSILGCYLVKYVSASGIVMIFKMAFQFKSVTGGLLGAIVASMTRAMRYGVARGIFSNEAGLGSAAITASAVTTNEPVKQGYINMTGTFWDTIVVCTITGLCIASSGVLGSTDAAGELIIGAPLTIAAFRSALGSVGEVLVTIGIIFFAFSTILGWEYNGEKALEYIAGSDRLNIVYRCFFACIVFVGSTTALDVVWNFSDIANYLMAIPNLISLVVLSGVIKKEVERFQPILEKEKRKK